MGFTSKCRVGRYWHAAHFCNLNLTSISYRFWNIRRKELKLKKNWWKKSNNSKMGNLGRSWHAEHVCSFNLPSVSYSFWNKGRKVLKFYKFDVKREITPKWVTGFTSKLQGG
jgi:hypothetical protein